MAGPLREKNLFFNLFFQHSKISTAINPIRNLFFKNSKISTAINPIRNLYFKHPKISTAINPTRKLMYHVIKNSFPSITGYFEPDMYPVVEYMRIIVLERRGPR